MRIKLVQAHQGIVSGHAGDSAHITELLVVLKGRA